MYLLPAHRYKYSVCVIFMFRQVNILGSPRNCKSTDYRWYKRVCLLHTLTVLLKLNCIKYYYYTMWIAIMVTVILVILVIHMDA